jgi:AraC-like DNA-binding protein
MWLLLVSFIVLWLIQLNFLVILNFFRIYKYCPHMTSLYSICAFLFINLIAFFTSRKSEFYNQFRKYEVSPLKKSEIDYFKSKLVNLMEGKKPHLNPLLSLSDLANKMAIPHRDLSQVINEAFNKNFYDFINLYRIADCKRIFEDYSNNSKTILEIAYEVGFNSKSAFNRAFKKHTGITPKEYKKSIHRSIGSN